MKGALLKGSKTMKICNRAKNCLQMRCPHRIPHSFLIECDPVSRLESGYLEQGCFYFVDSECIEVKK